MFEHQQVVECRAIGLQQIDGQFAIDERLHLCLGVVKFQREQRDMIFAARCRSVA